MVDLIDPEVKRATRRASKEEKRLAAERDEVIRLIMHMPLGRRWMHDKLMACHVFQSSFKGEASHATAFAEGERNVGLILLAELMGACPEAYILMMGEINGGRAEWDRTDPDDNRNWNEFGEWTGTGPEPSDGDVGEA